MKKLFIFLTMLVLGIVSSWALDVTVIKSSVSETTYGSLTSGTFTTNSTSGLSGVTVSGVTLLKNTSFAYGSSLGFENVTSGTITLSAPEGYTILGYSLTARSNTYSVSYTLTPAAGGSSVTTSTSGVTLVASGVNSRTTTISYSAGSQNHFYIPSLVITVKPDTKESVNVVYKEVYEGAVKCTHNAVTQVEGEAPSIPSGLLKAYCTYKYYTTEACTGDELSELTTSTTEVYAKVTFTPPFTLSSGFDGATWYYATLRGKQLRADENHKDGSGRYKTNSTNERTDVYKWAFFGNPYTGIYVMNKNQGDSKYLYKETQLVFKSGITPTSDNNALFAVTPNTNGGFTLRNVGGGNTWYVNDAGNEGNLGFWNSGSGANDGGSNWVVTEVPTVNVTYNLKWNSNTIKTATVSRVTEGEKASDRVPWSAPAYCSFSYDVETIESTTTEVNVTLNWNGPFEFSNSFNDATWYNLKINGDYLIYASTGNYNLVSNISSAESAGYNAFWGFIGNPVDGVQIINKSAGEGKSLAPFTPPSMAQGSFSWAVRKWGGNFSLDWSYNYLNNVDGVLKLYNSTTTSGDPMNLGCSVESASYRGLALAYVDEYANSHALGHYFGVSTASYNYLKNTITNALSVSESDYSDLELNISRYLSLLYPTTGYYRIKNNATGSYIAYGQPAAPYVEKTAGLIAISADKVATDFSAIIKLTGSNGTYKLSTEGRNVQSQTTDSQAFPATDSEGVDFVFNVTTPGIVSITNADSYVDANMDGSLHHATGWTVDGIVNWSASADNSKWILEDVNEMTVPLNGPINDNYYATLYLPFDVTISGATAYTLAQDENYLTPTEVEDNKVPAGTPVILKGSSSSATATTNTGDAFNSGSPLSCALTGTYANITIDTRANSVGNYVFGTNGSNVGFYHVKNENFSLKAYRAYLHLGSDISSTGCRIVFDDVVTGIVAPIGDTEEDTIIYNLSGQRLNKMQKGINIVNGKKVLF